MNVDATTDGRRIYIRLPIGYRGDGPRYAKRIAGASWRKVTKDWSFPLGLDTCYALRHVFGEDLQVRQPLSDWARAEIERRGALEKIVQGDVMPALKRVADEAPVLYAALTNRPYQMTGAAFISQGKRVLLGDQPGLGKTLQALAALIESQAKTILVGCPRTACRLVWEQETARWAPAITTYVAQGSRSAREKVMERFAFESG